MPARSSVATVEGRVTARFAYRSLGVFVDLGRAKALGSVLGLGFRGFPAWFLARGSHLSQIPGLTRKARVARTVAQLFRRDTAELGSPGHPEPLDTP